MDGTEFKGYRGAALDVTAEIEALRRARTVYERFAEAIENIPVGIMVHDADDRLVFCNSATREHFPETRRFLTPAPDSRISRAPRRRPARSRMRSAASMNG